jgi:uncharacterized protein with ParB-like and HNH nuclease domain
MNINDIPKLINLGSGVSLSLDGIEPNLERWEKSYGLDMNPDFQRGHVWDMETKSKFIEYMLKGGMTQPIRFNSPSFGGARHLPSSDLPETMVIVDGKQRLTAIREFMENKIAVFGGNFLKDFDNPRVLLLRTDIYYSVNKLQTRKELLQWYLEMNEGQIAHTKEELERVRGLLKAEK